MTDLNKEREAFEYWADAKCYYLDKRDDGHYEKGSTALAWEIAQYFMAVGRAQELEKAKAQAVPEHIVTLQRNGEVFKFDLLDLLRRSLKSSKVLKTRENWSHVSKMVGIGSTTSTLLCKEMNVDPDGTVFEASESGAEG